MIVRLQKYLASCGVGSRRKCEEYIVQGRVKINGETVSELGTKVNTVSDEVVFDGEPVAVADRKIYLAFNKPCNCIVSNQDPEGRKTVFDFIKTKERLFAVGRLDYHSRGLLLLTNDGEFANIAQHPSHNIKKIYEVKIRGHIKEETVIKLIEGVELDGKKTAPADVDVIKVNPRSTRLRFAISEGRNRQIRRMVEAVGYDVADLQRIAIGDIGLKGIKEGQYRELTAEEIHSLTKGGKNNNGPGRAKKKNRRNRQRSR